jgi:hypothetical protein
VPRKVILWTTPYKQLFKDPAIVVRAGDQTGRIDELVKANRPAGDLTASVLNRFRAGLNDSESRYAAMWKIYVFISDGLYYTGGLAQLMREHPCKRYPDAHKKHLEEAQDCIIRAIRVAWEWWETRCRPASLSLDARIPEDDLATLFRIYAKGSEAYFTQRAHTRAAVSAVRVEHYLHMGPDHNCRDIRYRFDREPSVESFTADIGFTAAQVASFDNFLKLCNVRLKDMYHEEIRDIALRLGDGLAELVDGYQVAAKEGVQPSPDLLRGRWFASEMRAAQQTADDADVASAPQQPVAEAVGRVASARTVDNGDNSIQSDKTLFEALRPEKPAGTPGVNSTNHKHKATKN